MRGERPCRSQNEYIQFYIIFIEPVRIPIPFLISHQNHLQQGSAAAPGGSAGSRALLNADVFHFATDAASQPVAVAVGSHAFPALVLTAKREGVALGREAITGIKCNIVLERIYAGAIPWNMVSVGIYSIAAVILAIAVVAPWISSKMKSL